MLLPDKRPEDLAPAGLGALSEDTLAAAAKIVGDVRRDGEVALRAHAERLGDLEPGAPLVLPRSHLESALEELPADARGVLERAAVRIRDFAERQRAALTDMEHTLPGGGGVLGHEVAPVSRAGCYAPGGRFPLPSTVLMTAVTARAAGVDEVWVASPRPAPVTLAAAALAEADGVVAVGGAQAIAAFAHGAGPIPACDAIVGPGNKWVTAAKQLVAGLVKIDMLAGPSEVLVIADDTADPKTVAADLLAQCEHDVEARGLLVTPSEPLILAVRAEIERQLATLPTRKTAEPAARDHSAAVLVPSIEEACAVSNRVAPEHLEVITQDPEALRPRLHHYGALFLGEGAAEVLGDYGLGPNHTLPTGGTARSVGGLSVFDFLRVRTYMRLDGAPEAVFRDAAAFARLEGLEAHARSAERRLGESEPHP
ncbi:MAG: histidinol dehydrogenase [Myxococcota bacterium]